MLGQLIRLEPVQISNYWEAIKLGLNSDTLDDNYTQEYVNEYLKSILEGKIQAWVYVVDSVVTASFTTYVYEENFSKKKTLRLNTAYSHTEESISPESWFSIFGSFIKYAKSSKLNYVTFTSRVSRIVDLAKQVSDTVCNYQIVHTVKGD